MRVAGYCDTSKERNSVLARNKKWCEQKPGKVKKNVPFKKDLKYCDAATKLLRVLVGGNPKSNKQCAKMAAGKKCAGPCAFLL